MLKMLKKLVTYSLFSVFGVFFLGNSSVSAEVDEEGYEYTIAKADEIDFAIENIFVTLISGDPMDENALYAVYTDEELEEYKKDKGIVDEDDSDIILNPYARAVKSKGFSAYYKSSKWITRNFISLSIEPKMYAWTGAGGYAGNAFKKKDRWDVLVKKHSGSKNWRNSASLKAQLNCHADFAKSMKTPWNIEPHRTTTNYAMVVAKGCNP